MRVSPEQVLNYFKTKYPKLKKVAIKDINSEMVQKYHGYAMFYKSDKFIYKGKTRQREVEPYSILLNKKLKDNLYVLLHQISHCISPYVERSFGDQWIYLEHEREFYENLMEIIKFANEAGIYKKTFKSVNDLMKFDKSV